MTSTDDPEKWEDRWHAHLDQLDRIRIAANDDESERITRHQNELKAIVTTIAARIRREQKENV